MEMITDNVCNDCGQTVTPGEHSGHNARFTGAWYCHDCGVLCDGPDDPEMTKLSLLEEPDPHCESVAGLYSWSENCEHPTPFAVFLDLTGMSDEFYGDTITESMSDAVKNLGFMELAHLANALSDYSERPQTVKSYTQALVWVTP